MQILVKGWKTSTCEFVFFEGNDGCLEIGVPHKCLVSVWFSFKTTLKKGTLKNVTPAFSLGIILKGPPRKQGRVGRFSHDTRDQPDSVPWTSVLKGQAPQLHFGWSPTYDLPFA